MATTIDNAIDAVMAKLSEAKAWQGDVEALRKGLNDASILLSKAMNTAHGGGSDEPNDNPPPQN